MDRIGETLKAGLLAFPDKNGPILWPRFDIRETLASASRTAMHYAQSAHRTARYWEFDQSWI
jgi:hypothetical protein